MKAQPAFVDPFAAEACAFCGGKMEPANNGMLRLYCSSKCRTDAFNGRPAPAVQVTPIAMRERTERQRREYVTKHLDRWILKYFGYQMKPFHQVLMEGLFAGGMREYLLPTEHAKTTYGAVIFPLASAAADPDSRHIVGATNLREAQMRVKAIKSIVQANPEGLLQEYPWLKRYPGKPWTVGELWFAGASSSNINPSVVAIGRGARDIKGRRAKTVFDDLEGMNESLTQGERDRLWNWLTLEAVRVFEDPEFFDRPLLAMMGTPYSADSLYFRAQRAGFRVYRQPYRYPDGSLIWPEKRRKILILKRTLASSPGAFEIAMKLDPTAADPDAMSYEAIREASQADATRFEEGVGHYKYTFLDPASGSTNKRVDYAGIGHVKIRWPRPAQRLASETIDDVELPWVEVYQPRAYRLGIISQVKLLQRIRAQYGGPVIYETNGPQSTTYRRLFEAFAPECVLIGFHTSERNKWDVRMGMGVVGEIARAGRLKIFAREEFDAEEQDEDADLYQAGDDQLVEDLLDTSPQLAGGDVRDPGVRSLLYEIRDLADPKADNHIVAGIWFAVRHSWEQRRRGQQPANTLPRPIADRHLAGSEELLRRGVASYVPHTGYGGGRVIDLRPYKGGAA